jgi:CRISPR-associated protein Cas1
MRYGDERILVLGSARRNVTVTKTYIARPRCDRPDYASLSSCATAREAWLRYVKTASRPYTFKTFELHFNKWRKADCTGLDLRTRRKGLRAERGRSPVAMDKRLLLTSPVHKPGEQESKPAEDWASFEPSGEEFVASEKFWRDRVNPKAKILALRAGASLRVTNGLFEISEQLPLHLAPDGAPHVVTFEGTEARRARRSELALVPKAIILPEHGWRITAEALKFCLAHDIALLSVAGRTSQGEKGLLSVMAGNPQSDAALVRAQCQAKPIKIAREIVRQSVETRVWFGRIGAKEAREFNRELDKARTRQRVMRIESAAATLYWDSHHCQVKTNSKRWPTQWARFSRRYSTVGQRGARHADHPVNALLNWSYAVAAGRLSAELFARGACLAIGFLHADREGRYSLAYDALELLRPLIDEKVFAFVTNPFPHGRFSRRAFGEAQRRGARVARTVEGLCAGHLPAQR